VVLNSQHNLEQPIVGENAILHLDPRRRQFSRKVSPDNESPIWLNLAAEMVKGDLSKIV
jgi:hypothetical protein